MSDHRPHGSRFGQAGPVLPAWPSALVVIAHPDDQSFGLGAVIDRLTAAGAAVHIMCYTHGGASTLNTTHADLHRARETELRRAAAELRAAGVTLLDYPDGGLGGAPAAELAGRVSTDRQRRAALLHASQVSPGAVLWRRLRLLGDQEYLRWLVPPAAAITSPSAR